MSESSKKKRRFAPKGPTYRSIGSHLYDLKNPWGIFRSRDGFIKEYNALLRDGVDWRNTEYRLELIRRTFFPHLRRSPSSSSKSSSSFSSSSKETTRDRVIYLPEALWTRLREALTRFPYDQTWEKEVHPFWFLGDKTLDKYFVSPPGLTGARFDPPALLPSGFRYSSKNESRWIVLWMEKQEPGTLTCSYHTWNNLYGGSLVSPSMCYYLSSVPSPSSEDSNKRFSNVGLPRASEEVLDAIRSAKSRSSSSNKKKERTPKNAGETFQPSDTNDILSIVESNSYTAMNLTQLCLGFYYVTISVDSSMFDLLDHPYVESFLKFVGGMALLNRTCGEGHFVTLLYSLNEMLRRDAFSIAYQRTNFSPSTSSPNEDAKTKEIRETEEILEKENGNWLMINSLTRREGDRGSDRLHYTSGNHYVAKSKRLSDMFRDSALGPNGSKRTNSLYDGAGAVFSFPLFPRFEKEEEGEGEKGGNIRLKSEVFRFESPCSNLMKLLMKMTSLRDENGEYFATLTLPELLDLMLHHEKYQDASYPIRSYRKQLQGPFKLEVSLLLKSFVRELNDKKNWFLPLVSGVDPTQKTSKSSQLRQGGGGDSNLLFKKNSRSLENYWKTIRNKCVQRLLFVFEQSEFVLVKIVFFVCQIVHYSSKLYADLSNFEALFEVWTQAMSVLFYYTGIKPSDFLESFDLSEEVREILSSRVKNNEENGFSNGGFSLSSTSYGGGEEEEEEESEPRFNEIYYLSGAFQRIKRENPNWSEMRSGIRSEIRFDEIVETLFDGENYTRMVQTNQRVLQNLQHQSLRREKNNEVIDLVGEEEEEEETDSSVGETFEAYLPWTPDEKEHAKKKDPVLVDLYKRLGRTSVENVFYLEKFTNRHKKDPIQTSSVVGNGRTNTDSNEREDRLLFEEISKNLRSISNNTLYVERSKASYAYSEITSFDLDADARRRTPLDKNNDIL